MDKNVEETLVDSKPKTTNSFDAIKEKASSNLSQLLQDLQDFEEAVRTENIPEIYRLYNSRLNDELKRSSNENHEIDELLMRKIHDRFIQKFPFMELVQRISPTISYYKIGQYYHERATVGIDASAPEIFVLPKIDKEWEDYLSNNEKNYSKQINELEARVITAQAEIDRIDEEISQLDGQIEELNSNKGFLNRKKVDEEIEALEEQKNAFTNEKLGWIPYIDQPEMIQEQKHHLLAEEKADELSKAIVEKEQRLIKRYFGSTKGLSDELHTFLSDYLNTDYSVTKGGTQNGDE
ncbi:MAG: viral A-type inclusion protein [Enterococcus sp.]